MPLKLSSSIKAIIILVCITFSNAVAQNMRVEVRKEAARMPKVCEGLKPVSLEGAINIPALVREAHCKGAGDMLIEYTYVMKSVSRSRGKSGEIKEETITYEVFMPVFKTGVNARGVLLVTERNGVPVPPEELEKERQRAGERLEKEEQRIERVKTTPPPVKASAALEGLMPVGMYPQTKTTRKSWGFERGSLVLNPHTFLLQTDLKFQKREMLKGRDTLVFKFSPRPNAQLQDAEKYLTQLNGTIWIDAADRIISRLAAWPVPPAPDPKKRAAPPSPITEASAPAIYVEMMRLPEGVWLSTLTRINGLDYPKLFDGIAYEMIFTYSEYKRFNTETLDPEIETPKPL
jgi:hypothetical protein